MRQNYKKIYNFASELSQKMKYLHHILRKYPISCFFLAVIWVAGFGTPPKTPLDHVSAIDKWAHTAMYLVTCGCIWTEYLRGHRKVSARKLFLMAWLAPIVMSGAIELLQAYCTGGRRSGEWLDFAANATGVTLAALIGMLVVSVRARGGKG